MELTDHLRQTAQAENRQGETSPDSSLHVTIRPSRRWERVTTPLAEDPLQTAPASATVYDEETIRDARIEEVEDIAATTPGMQMSGSTNRIVLRGAGDLLLFSTAEAPVGLYVDDVYIPNPGAFNFDLFDIERIEVLRGPQGYGGGRGAVAGDVRIRTVGPKPENSGALQAAYGSYHQRELHGTVNATTPDRTVLNRLTASVLRRDGTVRNLASGERISDRRNWGVRDQLAVRIGADAKAELSADFAAYNPVRPAPGPFDSVLDGNVSIFAPLTEKRRIFGGALRLDKSYGDMDVFSITAVRGFHFDTFGSDYGPNNLLNRGLDQSERYASHEIRLAGRHRRVDWTTGVFLYGEAKDQESVIELINAAVPLFLPIGHKETSIADQSLWSAAVFGEATWHVTDRLDLFAGLRGNYDHQSLDYAYVSNDGIAVLAPRQTRSESAGFTGLGWRAGISYELTPGVAPYVSVSRAQKPGGFNTILLPTTAVGFDKETATSYELGVKSEWLNGQLVANAAAFWFRRKNQQVQNVAAFGAPTVNARESLSKGLELTVAGRPAPGLDLLLTYAFTDSEFNDFPDFPLPGNTTMDLAGRDLPFVSEHGLTVAAHYVRPLTEEVRLVARADFRFRSSFHFDPQNRLRQPSYGLWNVRLGVRSDRWELSGWMKNLTDKRYRTSAATDPANGVLATPGDPRTVGLEFRRQF